MNNGIFLLLGTNLGDKLKNLSLARMHIAREAGKISKASSIYRTEPWGKTDQPEFYNQALKLQTHLSPHNLLVCLQQIEHTLGRIREEKWGARIIDIDILFYETATINEPNLTIPHPGIPTRRFTLQPLHEIASDWVHPVFAKTIDELLRECNDRSLVEKIL